jgi:D-aminopeptidase
MASSRSSYVLVGGTVVGAKMLSQMVIQARAQAKAKFLERFPQVYRISGVNLEYQGQASVHRWLMPNQLKKRHLNQLI